MSTSRTFTAGNVLTAAQLNDLSQGTIGYASVTAVQTGITATTDLTSLTLTVTLVASRRIRIWAEGSVTRTVVDGTSNVSILQDGTVVQTINVQNKVVTDPNHFTGSVVLTPSAGSHTYKLQLALTTGTGTTGLYASATQPAFILVEDIGA